MAERSVMAQIFVFGRVMNDLVPKESQSKQSYVCFDLDVYKRQAYSRFLEWHTSSDHVCPFLQLAPDKDTYFG